MRRIFYFFITLAAFALGLAASAHAQDVPAELAPILAWDISEVRPSGTDSPGSVTFVKSPADTLYAYYNAQGRRTVWEAVLGGVRYVYTPVHGTFAVDAEAQAFLTLYADYMGRYGDGDNNGVPDLIDALWLVEIVRSEIGDGGSPEN